MAKVQGLIAKLRGLCQTYRQQLAARGTATEEELEGYWPGGKENPEKKLWNWIMCHGQYLGFCRRIEFEERQAGTGSERLLAVLDALAETPEVVPLIGEEGEAPVTTVTHRTVTVFPKSDVALREIHARNIVLASLVDDYEVLQRRGTQDDVELLARLLEEQSYQSRVIVWIATTPGPGLPFPERTQVPELPAALADLTPYDFFLISAAFSRVNKDRLRALEKSTRNATRPDWSVFFAGLEFELHVSAASLMRDRSLVAVLATASEAVRGREEAMARSKAEAEATAPPRRRRSA